MTTATVDATRAAGLYEAGLTLKEVAAELGVTKDAVRTTLVRAGVRLRPPCRRRIPDDHVFDVAEAVRLYAEEHLTIREVAAKVGASRARVHRVIVASQVPRRTPKSRRASRIPQGKRAAILALWEGGATHHRIVRELRTTAEAIDRVLSDAGIEPVRRGARRLDYDRIRELWQAGRTLAQIADEVGSKPQYVWRVLSRMRPPARRRRPAGPIDRDRARRLLEEVGTIRRVAAELGADRRRVGRELRAAGVDTSHAATWERRKAVGV